MIIGISNCTNWCFCSFLILIWDFILFLLLLELFSNKLGFCRSQEIQYFFVCQCLGRNWVWSCHGLLHAIPSKLGNALRLFIYLIIHKCQVVSGHFRSFTTARITILSFSKCSKRTIFPKKLHWDMIFLVSPGKMIFLFPGNLISFFRWKMKDDLSQKTHGNMIYSLNVLKRWFLPKKLHWSMIFLISWGKMAFLFPENMILFLRTKDENDISQKLYGNMVFFVCW